MYLAHGDTISWLKSWNQNQGFWAPRPEFFLLSLLSHTVWPFKNHMKLLNLLNWWYFTNLKSQGLLFSFTLCLERNIQPPRRKASWEQKVYLSCLHCTVSTSMPGHNTYGGLLLHFIYLSFQAVDRLFQKLSFITEHV